VAAIVAGIERQLTNDGMVFVGGQEREVALPLAVASIADGMPS
jgi:hypothetical protein